MAHAAPRQVLANHVPAAVRESRPIGPISRGARLDLAIGLPLRNSAELERFIEQVTDPASPNYRQYLDSAGFTERFGPTQEDYDKLIGFLHQSGLTVTATHPNRMIVDVNGPVSAIESTLHVNMLAWNHPARGQFFAPDRDPWLDVDVAVLDITGLDNFAQARPMDLKMRPLSSASPLVTGSGPAGLFIGKDFRAAYAPNVTRTGAGQTIGLFELDGFYAADVTANFQKAGLTPVSVQTVLLNGFNGAPGGANIEVILDIMMAAYMAPGANVVVYEGTNWNDVLNRMATDNTAKQLSSSWCFSPINSTTEQIFRQMIAQGQSFFQASGDSGAYSGWIMPPADNPNVTVVGGTALTTTGPGGSWLSEAAWSGSGGGVSTTYAIPSYQQTVNMAALGGSNTMRNIPDVALTAAIQMYLICNNGQQTAIGGTSAAAPLWAGFAALANDQAAASHKPTVGFLNPTLYSLAAGSNYGSAMHDITSGSNGYSSVTGYDLASGWGTPSGQPLLDALSSMPTAPSFTLSATPNSVSVQAGSTATTTIQVTPQGGFSGPVTLSVTGLPAGVTGSFGATNASGASVLTLTAASSAAAASSVAATVTGKSGTLSASVPVAVTVIVPPSFSISASPNAVTVAQGGTAASLITVTPKNGFSGKVTIAASGLPSGVTASFSAASGSGASAASTLTFTATSAAPVGTATVTVTGTSGTASTTATIALTVRAGGAITVSAAPASLSIAQGASGTSTITVTPVNGFSGTSTLTISGLPSGISASFTPATTSTTSKLTLTAASSAAVGPATLTITATSGNISAKTTISLTINTAASFRISSQSTNVNVIAGATGTASITIAPQGGFTGTVALSASGLPTGVTASFNPANATTSSTLTLTATSAAAIKSTQFTINGVSGSLSTALPMTVTIVPPPDFAVALLPPALNVVAGAKGTTAVAISPINGFNGNVTLAATGLPTGVTASFGAPASAPFYLATLTVASSASVGTSRVTITATSGALSHSAPLSLTIVALAAGTALIDLSPVYNVTASAIDNLPFSSGGLDALGRSYSGVLLGSSASAAGTVFALGPMAVPDAVSGQTVSLPAGQFASLKLLATGVNGNQQGQTFKVTYTDGTSSSFTQSLSDWYTPQNYSGETKAITTTYRDNSTGTTDGRVFYVYAYSFSLNTSKNVKSITLPQNRNVVVLAMTLAGATSSTSH
jgi:hypothetical protein